MNMVDMWGAKLIHLVGQVESLFDEIIDATGGGLGDRRWAWVYRAGGNKG